MPIGQHRTSQGALDAHFRQPYVAALGEQASLLAEPPRVHSLQAVPAGPDEKGRI
jgi:quinol monooxygenase YgiN